MHTHTHRDTIQIHKNYAYTQIIHPHRFYAHRYYTVKNTSNSYRFYPHRYYTQIMHTERVTTHHTPHTDTAHRHYYKNTQILSHPTPWHLSHLGIESIQSLQEDGKNGDESIRHQLCAPHRPWSRYTIPTWDLSNVQHLPFGGSFYTSLDASEVGLLAKL